MILNQKQREIARVIARRGRIACPSRDAFVRHVRTVVRDRYGSLLTFLLIGTAIIRLCLAAWDFWERIDVRAPTIEPMSGEPFGLPGN